MSYARRALREVAALLQAASVVLAQFGVALSASASTSDIGSLRTDLINLLTNARVPGAVIVLVEDDRPSLELAWGTADRARERPMTMTTPVAVGSLSKNLTSLGALRLVSTGRLDLTSDVLSLLPEGSLANPFQDTAPLRLEHLLEHTAGLEGSTYYEYGDNADDAAPGAYLEQMRGKLEVRWPPGFFHSYANPGHTVAAVAMESACACAFDEFMQEQVFEPLGMHDSTFRVSSLDPQERARSYRADGTIPSAFWRMLIRPSGSLFSTGRDLIELLRFYTSRGATAPGLIDPALLERMERPQTTALARAGAQAGGYGLGNFGFFAADGVIFQGHTGATDGFRTWLGYHVDSRRGFALVVNGGDTEVRYALMRRIGAYLARDIEPIPVHSSSPIPGVDALAGWWVPFTHRMALRSWLWETLGAVRIAPQSDAGPVTSITVTPILPNAASIELVHTQQMLFRKPSQPVPTAGLVNGPEGEVYFVNGESYRRSSPTEAYGRAVALLGGLLIAPFLLIAWLLAVLSRGLRRQRIAFPVLTSLSVSGACLLGLAAIFSRVGLLGALDVAATLGRVGPASIALAILSVLGPLFLLRALRHLLRNASPSHALWGVAFFALLLSWLSLAVNGWVPLITWRI